MSTTGAVACGHPLTADAAIQILEAGGNAFDAAIAAQFTACVAEPVLTSLAGGGFLLAKPADGEATLLDFFTHSPRERLGSAEALYAIDADFGTATQTFHIGPGSIATPGTVAGMFAAHERFARLPMTELVLPAVRAAREGLIIDDFQGGILDIVRPIYAEGLYAEARTGIQFHQEALADSLSSLAEEGAELFYAGEIGARLAELCRNGGGHLSRDDLTGYQVIEREPLATRCRGAALLTNPPPSAGGALIRHTLNALEKREGTPTDVARALADTLRARAKLIDDSDQVNRGTTHISVVDGDGNVAAMTLSNGEGSGCLIPGTGIMTNNMLGEEDINPAGIDNWQPNRRLGSMMSPTLVLGEGYQAALGSGGSNRIRSAIVQVLVALLHHACEPTAAIARPRLHLEADLLSLEPGLEAAEFAGLQGLPAQIQQWDAQSLFFGGVHLVRHFDDGRLDAAGDPRRGGVGRTLGG
ncbi:MAG: gamma-glutamyltransferase [Gammaproteobacteria bacterium]|jgi:gamma-glutamyltranspeptidase/glutathione hydrolase|nr:MAG: gamma-glutamyltransferase [Gammaproteobacteria bacterium]